MPLCARILFLSLLILVALPTRGEVPGQWDDRFYLSPGCDGSVLAMAERPDGKIYVGGNFRYCDGVLANSLALFDPVTNSFEAIEANGVLGVGGAIGTAGTRVSALAWANGDLYVGGNMLTAGTLDVQRIARWDGSSWHRLGTSLSNGVFHPSASGASVNALAFVDGSLYVGGRFDSAATVDARNIARWSADQWHPLTGTSDNGVNGPVAALQPIGSTVAVGGGFSEAGGDPVNRLALWNGSSWSAIGEVAPGVGFIEGEVWALMIQGNGLYAGGGGFGGLTFQNADGSLCVACVMRWNGSEWQAFPTDPQDDYVVRDLAYHGGELFATGSVSASSSPNFRTRAALRWSGGQWQVAGGGSGLRGTGIVVASTSQGLLVGGGAGTDAVPANGLIRYQGGQFHPAGVAGGQGLNISVSAAIEFQGVLYVGGFNQTLGVGQVFRWLGNQWEQVPGTFTGGITSMAVYQGMLHIAGGFTAIDGQPVARIVRYDGAEWFSLGSGFDGAVNALLVHDDKLYATGHFDQAGGITVNNIAAWNGSSWSALADVLGNGLTPGTLGGSAYAYALATNGTDLFVTGRFGQAGGATAFRTARWDGANWFSMGNGIGSTAAEVTDLVWHDGALYIGGFSLTDADSNPMGAVARFVGGQWQPIATPAGFSMIHRLFSHNGRLYALNQSWSAANGLLRWDGDIWEQFDQGIGLMGSSGVRGALVVTNDRLVAGGQFSRAGPYASRNIAMFHFPELSDAIFTDRFSNDTPE